MAEGNPFFALELARAAGSPSAWAAITDRVLDLDEPTAALLRRLAVVGDDLDPFDVPALAGLPEPEAFALLDAALDAGALVAAGTRYRFRHDLVRQALVEQVPPHRRLDIHRDAARSLGRRRGDPEPGGPALAGRRLPGRGRAVAAGRRPPGVVARRLRRRARPARPPAGAPTRAHRRAAPAGRGARRPRRPPRPGRVLGRRPGGRRGGARPAGHAGAGRDQAGRPGHRPAHAGRAGADVAAGQAGPGVGLQRRRRDGLRHPGAGHRHGGGVPQAGAWRPATGPRW